MQKDEISFRSLQVKNPPSNDDNQKIQNGIEQEKEVNFFGNKKLSSNSNISSNINNINDNSLINTPNKGESKKSKVKINIKEYFNKNKQLKKEDFDSFLSFIGLRDIWSDEEEQNILWESMLSKAKNKECIDYDAALDGINELFEEDDDDDGGEIVVDKNNCFDKISNYYLDVNTNENCIDEYLNSIKDNIQLLFAIKFINEIYLKNNTNSNNNTNRNTQYSVNSISTLKINSSMTNGINGDLDKSDIDEEVNMETLKVEKKICININDIFNEIKTKYRFIIINSEELNNYFNNLNKNNTNENRKSISSNNLILKNEKKQEYALDKEMINYVSAMIELKLETKIRNDENKEENDELIDNGKNNEDKNMNILDKLDLLDKMTSDSYEAIINNNTNKDLINYIKMFNENYIMNKKKILYDKINKIMIENKNNNEAKQGMQKSKFVVVPDDENNYLKQQIDNLKERNEFLQKENGELKEKLSKNELLKYNNSIKINKLNLPNNIMNTNTNYLTQRNINHNRYKTEGENNLLNNIINQNLLKNSQNYGITNESDSNINITNSINLTNNNNNNNSTNNNSNSINIANSIINNTNNNINNTNINNTNSSNNNISKNALQFSKTGTSSFLDLNYEEMTNLDIFSVVGNNTMNDKFLLETTELGGNNDTGTPTLTPRSYIMENKDSDNLSDDPKKLSINEDSNTPISRRISAINCESINYDKNVNVENTKKFNFDKIDENMIISKKTLNIEDFNRNKFTFANDNLNANNMNYILERKKNCDFKYLSFNKKVVKLLIYNNEKIKANELFSDQINYILNGNKKKKGILLITSQCFYILDDTPDMNCVIRISHKLLSSISITIHNFNHLLISFSDGCFIIIEIYRRIFLLNYLKDIYSLNNYRKIKVNYCDSFDIKLNNNHSYTYEVQNNNEIILTPNFECVQKMGYLQKHKENIFSAYFTEKLVVLCSLGLIVFSKSDITVPKLIIPLIGASIKPMTLTLNEKMHCLRIKAINNEVFIFGSYKPKETNDWIQEIKNYQKLYELKMNEVMSNFIIISKNNN